MSRHLANSCLCPVLSLWHLPSYLSDSRAASHQKYIWGIVPGRTGKIRSDIFPPLNFTGGGQKCDIFPRFSPPVAFEELWFRNGARYRKSYQSGGGVVVSTLALINEVNLRRTRLVLRWVTVSGSIPGAGHLFQYVINQPPKANSAFHPSGVGKWVPASAGKAKAGMVHSVSGWTRGVQVKLRSLENACHTWAP